MREIIPESIRADVKKAAAPLRRGIDRVRLRMEYRIDRARYQRHMFPEDGKVGGRLEGRNLEAQLTKDYHRVEKGLALREPKRPFGAEVGERLQRYLPLATDHPVFEDAQTAWDALNAWNEQEEIDSEISPVRSRPAEVGANDPESFFGSRHSVRDFSSREVEPDILRRAVELAIQSPSVCNRQPWHVRFYRGDELRKALKHQNGNAGFGTEVPVGALVTVDARMFAGVGERNQPWIEGGIFAMSLVYALHSLGVDTCMLNLSLRNQRTARLKADLAISDCELPIMMIAIGYAREGHRRARSPRRPVADVVMPTSEGSSPLNAAPDQVSGVLS